MSRRDCFKSGHGLSVGEIINGLDLESDMKDVMRWALGLCDILGERGPLDQDRMEVAHLMASELMSIGHRLDKRFDEMHEANNREREAQS
jgi:hypothetical protein